MHIKSIVLAAACSISAASASLNTTQSFKIVSRAKTVQYGGSPFDDLYLTSYHSGAGQSDAVLLPAPSGINASANYTMPPLVGSDGQTLFNLTFDLGNEFPWSLGPYYLNGYNHWTTVAINAGEPPYNGGAYFINETGLQYTSSASSNNTEADSFGGWLVCNWWRGVPQLFYRFKYYNDTAPSNCADVYLVPEYF